jgi:transposase
LVSQYFVQVLDIEAIDDPWMWELLRRAPTPAAMRQLKKSTITSVLKKHRIRRIDADGIKAALAAPDMTVAPGVWAAVGYQVRVLVEALAFRAAQRRDGERRMAAVLARMAPPPAKVASDRAAGQPLPRAIEARSSDTTSVSTPPQEPQRPSDATILLSVPGLGLHCAATFLAEAAGPLAERNYPALRALAGVAPVTKQSGRKEYVVRRLACNNRLRNAVHHFASNSARHDPRSAEFLKRKVKEGCEYNRALRGLGDRLLKMIIAMLESGAVYDPARRGVPPREVEAAA